MSDNVFLFIPNLIGYTRIIMVFVSFYFMADNPVIFAICYSVSGMLDAVDGYAARALNQGSKFGAMLDMLTDRCATACLLVMLSDFYPSCLVVFQFLISLDISSHWIHMYSSMLKGDQNHKKIDLSTNFFLRLYYTSRPVLFTMCLGNELFFFALYLLHFSTGPTVLTISDNPVGAWSLVAYVSFPVCFLKQLISILQLVTAAQNIVFYDVSERRKSTS